MYKLIEHNINHRHIGGGFESIIETWNIYDPNTYGKYTTIRQCKAIGVNAASWRTYNREGMRLWEDDTKDKRKKEIIREVKEWFDTTSFDWLNLEP
jgi:hypothetical protein